MPPKSRSQRTNARKQGRPPPKASTSTKPPEESNTESHPPPSEPPPTTAFSSEALTVNPVLKTDKSLPDSKSNEPETVTVANPQDDVVLGLESVNEKDRSVDNDSVEKPKKVVKKTVKVVKKVIKRVPKKAVKPEIGSNTDENHKLSGNVDSISNNSDGVREAELKLDSDNVQLKVDNDDSISKQELKKPASSNSVQLKEKICESITSAGVEEELKAEIRDSIIPSGVEGEELKPKDEELKPARVISVELDSENQDSVVLAGNKVEFEKKEVVESENVEVKGSELMEIDDAPNNEGDVEEKGGEFGKDSGIGEGGKEDVADERGEGKLFRGELGAMERRKRRKTEIFIGRLDKDVQEEDVRKVFAQVGEIVDLKVIMNKKTGKKFAFLRYATAEEAKKALEKFAKVKICGKECGATPVEGNDTIYLGNIDKKWKDDDVVRLLNKIGIGKIDKVIVMDDPNNRECNRGFAFVEFVTINDAQLAYMKLQEKDVFGKSQKLKVAWAEPLKELDEEEMLKVKTVYAEFIPSSWDEEKLRDIFKKFGEIDDIVLSRNLQTSKRKDFAFISFKTRAAAIKCIESFGHELSDEHGTKVNVKVSLAKPKPKGKKMPAAKPFFKEVPNSNLKASYSNVRPSEPRNRTHPSLPRYGIQIPEVASTNVELVQLLREQASWRSPHAGLSNSPMDVHYSNLPSGRKRQYSVLETGPLYGNSSRYPHPRLDTSYSAASSSHTIMPPSGFTYPNAYHQRQSGHPSGSLYGARNYVSNFEIRDQSHESSFPYRRY